MTFDLSTFAITMVGYVVAHMLNNNGVASSILSPILNMITGKGSSTSKPAVTTPSHPVISTIVSWLTSKFTGSHTTTPTLNAAEVASALSHALESSPEVKSLIK